MKSGIVSSANSSLSRSGELTEHMVLVSDKVTYENNIGKFWIPSITPSMNMEPKDSTIPKKSTGNVINNNDNLGIVSSTISNYIELPVPRYLFYITDIKITPNTVRTEHESGSCLYSCAPVTVRTRHEYLKGTKFIITFEMSNKEKPIIIGVEE